MTGLRIGSILTFGSGVLRLVAGFISAPLLIQFLGERDFGIWAVINSVIVFASVIELGISPALTNELSRDSARSDWTQASRTAATSFLLITLAGSLATLAMFILAPVLTEWLFPADCQRTGLLTLRVMSLILLPRFWQAWAVSAQASLCRYDVQTLIELPAGLAIQIGSPLAVFAGLGPAGVAGWQLLVTVIACVAHFFVTRRAWPAVFLDWRVCRSTARRLLKFGLAQQAHVLGTTLFNQGDRIVVNGILGPEAAGVYAAVVTVASKIAEIPYMIFRVIPPAIASAHAQKNFRRLHRLFAQSVYANGLITLAAAFVVLYAAEPISRLILGSNFNGTEVQLLRTVTFVYGIYSIYMPSVWFGLGLGRPDILARWSVIGGVLMCLAMIAGGKMFGLLGAAWGNAAYFVTALIMYEIAPVMRLSRKIPAKAFIRLIACLALGWMFWSSSLHESLPLVGKLLAGLLVAPLVLLASVPAGAIVDLLTMSVGTLWKMLSSRRERMMGAALRRTP